MKGKHHEGKPCPKDVVDYNLGGFYMSTGWERPGHHLAALGDPKGDPKDFTEFDFQQDQLERWEKAKELGDVHSVKCGCVGSPLDGCSENSVFDHFKDVERSDGFAHSSDRYHPISPD